MKVSFAHIEKARITDGPLSSQEGERTGAFVMGKKSGDQESMVHMLVDSGSMSGWERVTITEYARDGENPPVPVMPHLQLITDIKEIFWGPEESVVMYFHESVPSAKETPAVHLWKSKRQNYILPQIELITPQNKPENVIQLPQPSDDEKTPPRGA